MSTVELVARGLRGGVSTVDMLARGLRGGVSTVESLARGLLAGAGLASGWLAAAPIELEEVDQVAAVAGTARRLAAGACGERPRGRHRSGSDPLRAGTLWALPARRDFLEGTLGANLARPTERKAPRSVEVVHCTCLVVTITKAVKASSARADAASEYGSRPARSSRPGHCHRVREKRTRAGPRLDTRAPAYQAP
ncbi:hypothetical protein [Haliangium ochraceum]|uniref:hypothetical protein n=1 Tax=Haliangium ochraceum TaxID=80816 RepID=UPI0018F03D80|nr:hypothetical protein [Haliangium ochraceum]